MTERPIGIFPDVRNHVPCPVHDVVFVRRDGKGHEIYSFSLHNIQKDARVSWTEVAVPVSVGQAGQGIFQITGDIVLHSNDHLTLQKLGYHLGRLNEIHVLYQDGRSVSSSYISKGLRGELTDYPHILERYPNIAQYRNEFGVYLSLVDDVANPRQIRFVLSGATCEKIDSQYSSPYTGFYNKFKRLDVALIQTIGADSGGIGR